MVSQTEPVESWARAGIRVYSCYEAGACGYWYHRELVRCGATNLVVAPQALETRRKGQKTDRLDARALLRLLSKNLEGDQDCTARSRLFHLDKSLCSES